MQNHQHKQNAQEHDGPEDVWQIYTHFLPKQLQCWCWFMMVNQFVNQFRTNLLFRGLKEPRQYITSPGHQNVDLHIGTSTKVPTVFPLLL